MNKYKNNILISLMILALMFFGVSPGNSAISFADSDECYLSKTVSLIAAQHFTVGTVTAEVYGGNLYVSFETNGDVTLTETHVYAGATRPINSNPGGLGTTHDLDNVQYDVHERALSELFPNGNYDTIYIAAHAVVNSETAFEGGSSTETAWGEGDNIHEQGNWAMYFELKKCEIPPVETGTLIVEKVVSGSESAKGYSYAVKVTNKEDVETPRAVALEDGPAYTIDGLKHQVSKNLTLAVGE
ncbi:MAG: Cna domain protein [Anaerosolibacter sp.]|uniref:hypothetical protein n=1 Tax=Anaerosolibacter sp. TaxID=1872527 RepID=UPI0026286EAC|nr:hypothetical protein [Anaerosolibacter sp.]MDF2548840.1 Cna domain protein [Anaerosolibacter sp.]